MWSFCIRYIHNTITLFKTFRGKRNSAAFTTYQMILPGDFLSLSTRLCMHTTHCFISLQQYDSTAVSEKKLIQIWFTIIIKYQITHLWALVCSYSVLTVVVWGDLKEAHLNLDKSSFSPLSKAVMFNLTCLKKSLQTFWNKKYNWIAIFSPIDSK